MLHVLVMAINFLHLGRFPSVEELGRHPNSEQLKVFERLSVCGSVSDLFPIVAGRSGPELVSSVVQLEKFLNQCPDFVDPYSKIPWKRLVEDDGLFPEDQFPELVPQRNLDASRIKLVGTGSWPMEKFIEGSLWLPFQEPKILRHGMPLEGADLPSFQHESKEECLRLAKRWDTKNLLALY